MGIWTETGRTERGKKTTLYEKDCWHYQKDMKQIENIHKNAILYELLWDTIKLAMFPQLLLH